MGQLTVVHPTESLSVGPVLSTSLKQVCRFLAFAKENEIAFAPTYRYSIGTRATSSSLLQVAGEQIGAKGEVHPKIITSYLVVFGALSQMVKIQGACNKPLWIYKRLNNCAASAPDSDDVLVIEEEVFLCAAHAKEATTKTSSLSGAGGGAIIQSLIYRKRLIACTSDLHHSTQRPEHYEI